MDAPPFLIPRERLGVEWHRDFEAARAYQSLTDWHVRRPPGVGV